MKRIIWAVDPSVPNRSVIINMAKNLKVLIDGTDFVVDPVYVLSPDDMRIKASVSLGTTDIRTAAEQALEKAFEKIHFQGLNEPTILLSPSLSLQSRAKTLESHAKKMRASFIAISNLSKGRLDRILIGSFTETLTYLAEIPIMVLKAHARMRAVAAPILFPTDFSDMSKRALDSFLARFPVRGHEIVILHHFGSPVRYSVEPFSVLPISPLEVGREMARLERVGERWAKQVEKRGERARFVLSRDPLSTQEVILKEAKERHALLIAMASHSGHLESFFHGSVTRRVLREGKLPMWIWHPPRKSESSRRREKTREAISYAQAS